MQVWCGVYDMLGKEGLGSGTLEGRAAAHHLVQDTTQRIDIAPAVDLPIT